MKDLSRQAVALIVLAGTAILLAVVAFGIWRHSHTAATEARVDHAKSGATIDSAKDAIAVQGNVAADQGASEDLTRSNEKEIRNAKGSDQAVDPAARDAGLASLCRRASYRATDRCLRVAAPGGVAPRGAGR